MSREYTFPFKFKLIVDHLDAVRTLHEYVSGVGLKKDLQALSNHLQQDLSRSVLRPAGWEDLYAEHGSLYSSPKSKPKWRVVRGDFIAIEVCPAWPLEEFDPYVNLYVPPNWKKQSQFIAKLKAPQGFEHASQYAAGELAEESSVWKYVPYRSCVGTEGSFEAAAFREATMALVSMEKGIDKILEGLA
jgi:hypothetical protein